MSGTEPDSAANELYCPTCEKTFASGDRCAQDNTRLVRIAKSGDQLIGRELDGRYTILEKLGQGGMGTVYRGTQHSVGREVAIKVVTPSLVAESVVIKRFLREAKLASRLSHPNAVSVLDFGQTDDGLFYLVMELVLGRTLDKVLETERVLSPQRLVRVGSQICDALEGAHQMNIVHRDLKPANVMLMTTGRDFVKVLDFGLAKSLTPDIASATMTNAGALLGTPAFMPPELVTGQDCDARADLYSLGCLLHYAASGSLPFVAGSVHELIAMHASEPPPPLVNLPAPLARVIARLLEKEPARRFQTATATREALEAALSGAAPVDVPDEASAPVSGPVTVLGWAGTITPPPGKTASRTSTPAGAATPQRTTAPTGAARPLTPVAATPRISSPASSSGQSGKSGQWGPVDPSTDAARPAALKNRNIVTPVHGSLPLDPAEVDLMASSPTLLVSPEAITVPRAPLPATPIPHVIPPTPMPSTGTLTTETSTARDLIAPGDRKRTPILLAVGAVVLALGAIAAFFAVRGSPADQPAPPPAAAAPIPAAAATPSTPPPPAVDDTAKPVVEPVATKPVVEPVATKPVVEPVATTPLVEPAATKPAAKPVTTKPVTTKPRPVATKPAVTKPDKPAVAHPPTGPIRVNPGAF